MNKFILIIMVAVVIPAWGKNKATTLDELVEQVRKEGYQEKQHAQSRETLFLQQRNEQKKHFKALKLKLTAAQHLADELRETFEDNEARIVSLEQQGQQQAGTVNDLFAIVQQNAAEIRTVISLSMVSAQFPQRGQFLDDLAERQDRTSMEDLKKIWLLLLEEMNQSGKIVRFQAPVITPDGTETTQRVTRIGVFGAVTQGQFLRYLPEAHKFVELARQPADRFRSLADQFEKAQSGTHTMVVDPSKGAILALMVQSPDWKERIQQGGIIGYIILLIGAVGLTIVIARFYILGICMRRVKQQQLASEVQEDNPLGRLIDSAKTHQNASRDALALHLDETIHQETSRLHFGLTTLTVFAAVSPLLGLLGTVTGMIQTFESISLFGTGDPKLMSGGISQALVTTQLGLAVAIPLLLLHSFLHGRANSIIEVLDEKGAELFEKYDGSEIND